MSEVVHDDDNFSLHTSSTRQVRVTNTGKERMFVFGAVEKISNMSDSQRNLRCPLVGGCSKESYLLGCWVEGPNRPFKVSLSTLSLAVSRASEAE